MPGLGGQASRVEDGNKVAGGREGLSGSPGSIVIGGLFLHIETQPYHLQPHDKPSGSTRPIEFPPHISRY